ncbi:cytochrome P450 [Trichoderma camerunense]
MLGLSTTEAIVVSAIVVALYLAGLGIWRLFLHPLAKFPGPRIAALTRWYECYFDVYLGGQYFKEIERLHSIYGPVVRISPEELHIKDPDWVTELYPLGNNRPRDKYAWFLSEGTNATSSATVKHHVHRQRRSTLSPNFSKQSIMGVERSIIQQSIDKMCDHLDDFAQDGTPVAVGTAFASLTVDVVLQMWYAAPPGQTRRWSFFPAWTEPFPALLNASHFLRHFPKAFLLLILIPKAYWDYMPGTSLLFKLQQASYNLAKEAMEDSTKEENNCIIRGLKRSSLPFSERSLSRLSDEGFSFVMASTESTAQTLGAIIYHLADNPDILAELRKQLTDTQDSWSALEELPYLRYIVMEAMRVTASVTGRLTRIATNEDLQYQNWLIPRGIPVSMDHHFTHLDPVIFPEPHRFNPDRWRIAAERGESLEKYFLPFGRGSRMCIGINLAKAIIYLSIARIVRRYNFELYGTTREDVDVVRDNLLGAVNTTSKGVRVKLSRRVHIEAED